MSQKTDLLVSAQGFEYGVKHFYNQKSGLISEILFDTLNLNRNETSELLKLGAIYINHQRQTIDTDLDTVATENQLVGHLFRVHTKPRRYNCNFDWLSLIIYENQDFIIINKPSGIPSHPSVDNVIENSLAQTSQARQVPLFITHRLDTLTSGLIVYSKTKQFVKSFNKQLQEKTIEKKYVALVEGPSILRTKVIHYMQPSPRAPKTVSEIFVETWAFCELEILQQKKISLDLRWLKINLLTGRTHQIRSQLANLQAPILGDLLYGSKSDYQKNAIALRACELAFNWGAERMQFNLGEEFEVY